MPADQSSAFLELETQVSLLVEQACATYGNRQYTRTNNMSRYDGNYPDQLFIEVDALVSFCQYDSIEFTYLVTDSSEKVACQIYKESSSGTVFLNSMNNSEWSGLVHSFTFNPGDPNTRFRFNCAGNLGGENLEIGYMFK